MDGVEGTGRSRVPWSVSRKVEAKWVVPASDPRVINCVSVAARLPPGQQVLGTGARSSVAAIAWVRLGGESSHAAHELRTDPGD